LEETNKPLLRFYQRLGFKDTEQTFWRKNLADEDIKLLCLATVTPPLLTVTAPHGVL